MGQIYSFPPQPDVSSLPEREKPGDLITFARLENIGRQVQKNRLEGAAPNFKKVDLSQIEREADPSDIQNEHGNVIVGDFGGDQFDAESQRAYTESLTQPDDFAEAA